MLYYTEPYKGRAKFHETLIVAKYGSPPLRSHETYEDDLELKELIGYGKRVGKDIWKKVEFKKTGTVSHNKAGFRVTTAQVGEGVYPPFLISSFDISTISDRCFFTGYTGINCFSIILLSKESEIQTLEYISSQIGRESRVENGRVTQMCRVFYSQNECLVPMEGYISNIEYVTPNPLQPGVLSLEDFDALDQRLKDSVFEFKSNTGRRYLVTCPPSCK